MYEDNDLGCRNSIGKILGWGFIIVVAVFFLLGSLAETGVFDPPDNAYKQGDVAYYQIQTGSDETGQPIYSNQAYECTSERIVLIFWSKGCNAWKPLEQELSADQVFEMIGKGYLGVASGSYAPIPGTGFWVGVLNALRRMAWSFSVESGLAMAWVLLIPTVIGGLVVVGIAVRFGPRTVVALGVPLSIFVFGSMTLHEGGRCLLGLFAVLLFVFAVVWLLRKFSHTRVMTATGDVFDYVSVGGDQPQFPTNSSSSGGLRKS